MNKLDARIRRSVKSRAKIKLMGIEKGVARLTIHRSLSHIYAQIIAPVGGKVLAQASTLELRADKSFNDHKKSDKAKVVGKLVAERAKQAGVTQAVCDRSGFKFHGRVAALVEAARENGLTI